MVSLLFLKPWGKLWDVQTRVRGALALSADLTEQVWGISLPGHPGL